METVFWPYQDQLAAGGGDRAGAAHGGGAAGGEDRDQGLQATVRREHAQARQVWPALL